MKSYIFFAVVLLAIIACNQKTDTTTTRNTDVDTNTDVSSNSIQLNNYIQALTFIIEYDSLNNGNYLGISQNSEKVVY